MNGKRAKALKRQFREKNGRNPRGTMAVLIDDDSTFTNKQGVQEFAAGYEAHGELRFRKVMGVGMPSEWRRIKKLR